MIKTKIVLLGMILPISICCASMSDYKLIADISANKWQNLPLNTIKNKTSPGNQFTVLLNQEICQTTIDLRVERIIFNDGSHERVQIDRRDTISLECPSGNKKVAGYLADASDGYTGWNIKCGIEHCSYSSTGRIVYRLVTGK